jgi:hypothetical protein
MSRRATAVRLLKKVKVVVDWGFVPVHFTKKGKSLHVPAPACLLLVTKGADRKPQTAQNHA